MLSAYKNTAYVLLGGALCKAWQLVFSCFSLCALVKRCFGKDIMLIPQDGGRFRATVDVAVSDQFLGWIVALGTVKIVGPEAVVKKMRAKVAALSEQYW